MTRKNLTRSEVLALLIEAKVIKGAFEVGMGKKGTLTFGKWIVAFLDPAGFYPRAEVTRFISDYRSR